MMRHCHNIEDLRLAAQRRLPRGLFDFIDRATEDDVAMRRNRSAFERWRIVPRAMVDVGQRSLCADVLGKPQASPLIIAPAGPAGFFWHHGELALAHAAASAGVPFTVSTYAMTPLEDIVATGADVWMQLYLWNDRSISHALARRAAQLGVSVLLLTVDTPVLGRREYLSRNGFAPPFKANWRAMLDMCCHPRWLASVPLRYALRGAWPRLANVPKPCRDDDPRVGLTQALTWSDVARLRDIWPGKLVLKGILRAPDAARAVALGVDGIVVSNHGGRNLDAIASPLEVLPEVVRAVGGAAQVLLDSGIRRGSDVFKALALGASAVLVGRAALYGVAAAGQPGAQRVLQLLLEELDTTMALAGCTRTDDIGADFLLAGMP